MTEPKNTLAVEDLYAAAFTLCRTRLVAIEKRGENRYAFVFSDDGGRAQIAGVDYLNNCPIAPNDFVQSLQKLRGILRANDYRRKPTTPTTERKK